MSNVKDPSEVKNIKMAFMVTQDDYDKLCFWSEQTGRPKSAIIRQGMISAFAELEEQEEIFKKGLEVMTSEGW